MRACLSSTAHRDLACRDAIGFASWRSEVKKTLLETSAMQVNLLADFSSAPTAARMDRASNFLKGDGIGTHRLPRPSGAVTPRSIRSSATPKKSGSKYVLPIQTLLDEAPRIRVRNLSDRQREQLGELVVANERLAGRPVSKARQRVEFLKRRREVWELTYKLLTKQDAAATLAALEEAHKKVAAAISERSRERRSVGELKREFLQLQAQVGAAHEQLHHTQELVQLNRDRIQQLSAAAQAAELKTPGRASARIGVRNTPAAQPNALQETSMPISRIIPVQQPATEKSWMPVAFSENVRDGMTVIHHAGQPWVLFRDAHGSVACIEDCCAHRACPLSLGKVENGQAMCAYHGWKYNAQGECTDMPSTVMCSGIRVKTMVCEEVHGVIWVAETDTALQRLVPDCHHLTEADFAPVATVQIDLAVSQSALCEHLLQGEGLDCRDGKPTWLGAAVQLVFGRAKDVQAGPSGLTASKVGKHALETHIVTSTRPDSCRWLFRLSVRRSHWAASKLHRRAWQRLAQQAIKATRNSLEREVLEPSGFVAS